MQGHESMNIQSVKFSNIFKAEVAIAVQKMLDGEEAFRELEKVKGFVVSYNDSYNDKLLNVFSGEALGLRNVEKVFLFFK